MKDLSFFVALLILIFGASLAVVGCNSADSESKSKVVAPWKEPKAKANRAKDLVEEADAKTKRQFDEMGE